MSQAHITRVIADWSIGLDGLCPLEDTGVQHAALANLPDEYTFLPAESYCPVSDVPDWYVLGSVAFHGDQACIASDAGMFVSCWLLAR